MLRSVKGMNDLFGEVMPLWRQVEETARAVHEAFGFREIRTPLLERTELFARGVGETTDIVEKEMYSFTDRGGEHLALRPEGTAGVVRAFVQHKLHGVDSDLRLYYLGPMYRRERPQKGRFRQFYQFGVEALGVAAPELDAEVIAMLHLFLSRVGLEGVVIEINSLGAAEDRPHYLEQLVGYLQQHRDALCADCLRRLERAPLRVLDCKVEGCRAVTADAPRVLEHLGDASREHFDAVRRSLDRLRVPYRVNPNIVRGLDYYTRTVFEALSEGLGSQNAICGGGRYDELVAQLGGPATPAIGYAQGIDRLVMLLQAQDKAQAQGFSVALVPVSAVERPEAETLAHALRREGIHCILDLTGRSVKAQLRRAGKARASYAVVLGERELAERRVALKPIEAGGDAAEIAIEDLVAQLIARRQAGGASERAPVGPAVGAGDER